MAAVSPPSCCLALSPPPLPLRLTTFKHLLVRTCLLAQSGSSSRRARRNNSTRKQQIHAESRRCMLTPPSFHAELVAFIPSHALHPRFRLTEVVVYTSFIFLSHTIDTLLQRTCDFSGTRRTRTTKQ